MLKGIRNANKNFFHGFFPGGVVREGGPQVSNNNALNLNSSWLSYCTLEVTLIALMGGRGTFSPLSWQSERIRCAVRSNLAGETLSMSDGIDNAVLSLLCSPLGVLNLTILHWFVWLTVTLCLIPSSQQNRSETRLRLEISSIKDLKHNHKNLAHTVYGKHLKFTVYVIDKILKK